MFRLMSLLFLFLLALFLHMCAQFLVSAGVLRSWLHINLLYEFQEKHLQRFTLLFSWPSSDNCLSVQQLCRRLFVVERVVLFPME